MRFVPAIILILFGLGVATQPDEPSCVPVAVDAAGPEHSDWTLSYAPDGTPQLWSPECS